MEYPLGAGEEVVAEGFVAGDGGAPVEIDEGPVGRGEGGDDAGLAGPPGIEPGAAEGEAETGLPGDLEGDPAAGEVLLGLGGGEGLLGAGEEGVDLGAAAGIGSSGPATRASCFGGRGGGGAVTAP